MITEIVTFKLPTGTTREDLIATYQKTTQTWHDNPDLIRKYYLFDPETCTAGGVYLWKERWNADKWHGDEYRRTVKALFGSDPISQFFETPLVVDNANGEIAQQAYATSP
ncbi:MAG TPA: hypothetical protein VKP30_22435 [Polyangiaceae bacterium]|nr:hypothetical protein [Polyangiaceae bacterium]